MKHSSTVRQLSLAILTLLLFTTTNNDFELQETPEPQGARGKSTLPKSHKILSLTFTTIASAVPADNVLTLPRVGIRSTTPTKCKSSTTGDCHTFYAMHTETVVPEGSNTQHKFLPLHGPNRSKSAFVIGSDGTMQ
jgi:hypothetical protein